MERQMASTDKDIEIDYFPLQSTETDQSSDSDSDEYLLLVANSQELMTNSKDFSISLLLQYKISQAQVMKAYLTV
jgi:hypothetical protein